MKIVKSEFVKGVVGDNYNINKLPQIAFFGRSNAGKSSVINSLADRKNLIRVSKKPGETKEANFYIINDSFYFIDFPGYGYSKLSIKTRNKMAKRILWYIEKNEIKPTLIFLIIDIKVGLTDLDREMIKILKENNHNINIIGNKIDKSKKIVVEKKLKDIQEEEPDIPVFLYSAKTKKGREEIIENIAKVV